jgi:hypothetical protein
MALRHAIEDAGSIPKIRCPRSTAVTKKYLRIKRLKTTTTTTYKTILYNILYKVR